MIILIRVMAIIAAIIVLFLLSLITLSWSLSMIKLFNNLEGAIGDRFSGNGVSKIRPCTKEAKKHMNKVHKEKGKPRI